MHGALKKNPLALHYASKDIKSGRALILAALKQNGLALQYVSDDFKNVRDVVLVSLSQNSLVLQYTSDDVRNDVALVSGGLSQNGLVLRYVGNSLKSNKNVVLVAVAQNGLALQYAGEGLRNDMQVVLTAVLQSCYALAYANDRLKVNTACVWVAKRSGFREAYFTGDVSQTHADALRVCDTVDLVSDPVCTSRRRFTVYFYQMALHAGVSHLYSAGEKGEKFFLIASFLQMSDCAALDVVLSKTRRKYDMMCSNDPDRMLSTPVCESLIYWHKQAFYPQVTRLRRLSKWFFSVDQGCVINRSLYEFIRIQLCLKASIHTLDSFVINRSRFDLFSNARRYQKAKNETLEQLRAILSQCNRSSADYRLRLYWRPKVDSVRNELTASLTRFASILASSWSRSHAHWARFQQLTTGEAVDVSDRQVRDEFLQQCQPGSRV